MDGYMAAMNFTSIPIQGFNFLDGYVSSQPKYPIGVPCEDCGEFCKQQCYIWAKVDKVIEDFKINYPDSWAILNPDEYTRRATELLKESKVRYR